MAQVSLTTVKFPDFSRFSDHELCASDSLATFGKIQLLFYGLIILFSIPYIICSYLLILWLGTRTVYCA